jgi:hypothetical protein
MANPVKTAAQANANWKARMADATTKQKFVQGVQGVTVSPNSLAAQPQAIQKYLNAVTDAANSGRLAAGNNRVDVNAWKTATASGADRLASGAAAKANKQLAAAQRMQGAWQSARDAAAAIPHDGTLASASAKVMAAMTAMRSAVGKSTM